MPDLVRLALANAAAALLLACVAWVASRRVRRPSIVHGLWVLSLIKLVTPPLVPLPLLPGWSVPGTSGISSEPRVVVIEARPPDAPVPVGTLATATPATEGPSRWAASDDATNEPGPAVTLVGDVPPRPRPSIPFGAPDISSRASRAAVDPLGAAGAVLVVGALAVAALAVRRMRRFARLLRLAVPAPAPLRERVAELAGRVGLRRTPAVELLPARLPPLLWPGRGGPRLLLPVELLPRLSDDERDAVLVHELAHVRRRDHWVRVLELGVTVLFWWYPVTWWARAGLRRAEERCCDEWVLRVMPAAAAAYAEGLLKSVAFVGAVADPLPAGASGAGPVRDLEARLEEILMTRPRPHLSAPARLGLTAVALVGLAVFPTQAQSPEPDDEPIGASPTTSPPAPPDPPAAPAAPAAAPAPRPAPAPAAPASPAAAPLSAALAAPMAGSPDEDDPEGQDLEERQRRLEEQRAELQRRELDLARYAMELEARRQAEHMRAEAARLRAAGRSDEAARVAAQFQAVAARLAVQRRQLGLERSHLDSQRERERALRSAVERLRALEREGRETEARELRLELTRLEKEHARAALDRERQQIALEREAMEAERRARALMLESAGGEAMDHAALEAELERARERQEEEMARREREIEVREAERVLQAKELEAHAHEAGGRRAEAERARAETEKLRGQLETLRAGLHREHLLAAIADVEHQLEAQLEALRHLNTGGAAPHEELEREMARLEAALEALRGER